jgi:type VI secretion system secreted protein VgrG
MSDRDDDERSARERAEGAGRDAAGGAASGAAGAASSGDPEAVARAAAQGAASAGMSAAEEAVPEEAAAAASAATAAAEAAMEDPSEAASAAAGAGVGTAANQLGEAAGVPSPVSDAVGGMAQGAISQALTQSAPSAPSTGSGSGAGSSAGSGAAGRSAAAEHAGFQAPAARAEAAGSGASGGAAASDQGHVDLVFECDDVDVFFDVLEVEVKERLNAPYAIELRISTDDLEAELGRLLGADCRVLIRRQDQEQRVLGVCAEILEGASSKHRAEVRLTVVPALQLMELRRDTRIFQEMSVPDILDDVLTKGLGGFGRTHRLQLDRTYPVCEYRVQYDETDLDFALRLMEEEGIVFFFDHEGEKEELVLVDDPARHDPIDRPDGEALEMRLFESGQGNLEVVRELHRRGKMRPTKLSLRHWAWTRSAMVEGDAEGQAPGADELPDGAASGAAREEYDHDARPLTFHEYSEPTFGQNDNADQIRLRREAQARDARVGFGRSTVVAMRAGRTFSVSGHRAIELDGEYLLTAVTHRFSVDAEGERYANTFECLPMGIPFRPVRTRRKPRVPGVQTAIVVGPAGEEIFTDIHGRIKVQFHWDRVGVEDEHSSCFMRVMQPWAGEGWGFVFIPRIGMEVVVTFVNGDPDRPLVTGTVYNGTHGSPYPLPDEKTKSTIKTRSSPNSEGYNELTFEDAAGEEQIIVHAQKDYNETVENDHNTTVHNNQTLTVDANQTETVGGDQTITVKKNQTETVKENVTITVEGERTETVTKKEVITLQDLRETYVGKTELHQVTEMLTEQFDAGRTTTVTGEDSEEVKSGSKTVTVTDAALEVHAKTAIVIAQNQQHFLQLEDGATLSTGADFTITNGQVSVASEGGKLTLTGAQELSLVCGSASITLKSSGEIDIQASTKATMGTPGTSFTAEPAGATVNGAKITSQAIGIHEVMGALVKIN